MSDIQQELAACRESAENGYQIASESFDKLKDALAEEQEKLREADRRQQSSRLENDDHFQNQIWEMNRLERETVSNVEDNLRDLKRKMSDFTIVLYGRTMAGKSTLMEILRHGDGSSIGKGAQRTTRDVRAYTWNGLKIFDVPGTCSFGGAGDDKLAFEAAKDADIALFLLTDDAPQPSEAQRLAELKKLGKPVLGIVNVKQVLNPDRNNSQRRINVLQLRKKLSEQSRLEEIVRQFKEFSQKNGYNFDDVPFVYSHLQSAFFSQRENDASLYELSNFAAVENFILDKVQQDGQFIRIKTFIDAVARPMQEATATLYRHSRDSIIARKSYLDKIEELNSWRANFIERCNDRVGNFIGNIEAQLNSKINYVVENFYNTEKANEEWRKAVESLNITRQCQNFIENIGEEVTDRLHDLSDELTQDLEYTGISFETPKFVAQDTDDVQGGLLLAAPLLALTPIGWAGAAIVGLGALFFGESQSKKIEKAKNALREKLISSRNEIRNKTEDNVLKILNEQVLHRQIDGFGRTLESMSGMMKNLAYAQYQVARTIRNQYRDLNFQAFIYAVFFSDIDQDEIERISVARVVGKEFVVFNVADMSPASKFKISKLIGEKTSIFTVSDEKYIVDEAKILVENYLDGNWNFIDFIDDGDRRMSVIALPRYLESHDDSIQIAQQTIGEPVVFY